MPLSPSQPPSPCPPLRVPICFRLTPSPNLCPSPSLSPPSETPFSSPSGTQATAHTRFTCHKHAGMPAACSPTRTSGAHASTHAKPSDCAGQHASALRHARTPAALRLDSRTRARASAARENFPCHTAAQPQVPLHSGPAQSPNGPARTGASSQEKLENPAIVLPFREGNGGAASPGAAAGPRSRLADSASADRRKEQNAGTTHARASAAAPTSSVRCNGHVKRRTHARRLHTLAHARTPAAYTHARTHAGCIHSSTHDRRPATDAACTSAPQALKHVGRPVRPHSFPSLRVTRRTHQRTSAAAHT